MNILKLIKNPYKLIYLIKTPLNKVIPDKMYLKLIYRASMGKKLNLNNPVTYNEKLQWLKLYDRKPEYSMMVDKYAVREYIKEKLGKEYLIPLLGVWDKFEDIDFDKLPDQFVLKPNHTSGNVFICKDKKNIDFIKLKKDVNAWLKREYYWLHREWPYKNISPKIIAEKYMVDESGTQLKDYKFFCFNGKVKSLFIATDRPFDTRFDFYDENFNHLPFTNGHENSEKIINKPEKFEKMILLAEKLSQNIPHVRVDFYNINGQIYFGEMTFYHWSGLMPFDPEEWDNIFGSYIKPY